MVTQISFWDLTVSFIPVVIVLFLMWKTGQNVKHSTLAIARMLLQLLLVGYVLLFIFANPAPWYSLLILLIMTLVATWISIGVTKHQRGVIFFKAMLAIVVGAGFVLAVITQGVLKIDPWYNPRYLLPLAGMLFASSMTAVSLCLERYESELQHNQPSDALNIAYRAAMIPVVNSMLAVGVVSLPGMMTGQILSGVEPFIAARYQILVMCMIFSSTGLTVFVFLKLIKKVSNGS